MNASQSAKNIGLHRAFEVRKRLGIPRNRSLNVFETCERLGIKVHFADCKSLEGAYIKAPRTSIFLPTTEHRPTGRIAFTCAHELGHHELGHGTRVDDYVDATSNRQASSLEELGADVFAAFLLMPRPAIEVALRARQWHARTLNAEQAYSLACLFGVGYSSLLHQLHFGLGSLDADCFSVLKRHSPKSIRAEIYPPAKDFPLVSLDESWIYPTVDVEVGTLIVTSKTMQIDTDFVELEQEDSTRRVWRAKTVGVSKLKHFSNSPRLRIAATNYAGYLSYKFLPEVGSDS